MMALPPAILEMLHLSAGATVGMAVGNGLLVIAHTSRPRYSLEELLNQCDANPDVVYEGREWLNTQPNDAY